MLAAADYGQTQNPWIAVAFFAAVILAFAVVPIIVAGRKAER